MAEAETETKSEADEYDYGIDDMEITCPEESVDLTEAVEDDGSVQQPGEEIITEQPVGKASVEQIAEKAAPEQAAPPPPPYKLPPLHLLSKTVKTMN